MSTHATPPRGSGPDVLARDAVPRGGRFPDALAAASAARPPGRSRPPTASSTGRAPPARAPPARKVHPRGAAADEAGPPDPSSATGPPAARSPSGAPDPPGTAQLRACFRAAPAVVAAALRPGGAGLVLTFGAALSLDLRSGAQGLEVTLHPGVGLERATRAELPGLVEALRARGLRVARAEVRPRAPPPRRAR